MFNAVQQPDLSELGTMSLTEVNEAVRKLTDKGGRLRINDFSKAVFDNNNHMIFQARKEFGKAVWSVIGRL
jgi:hypothetical protein